MQTKIYYQQEILAMKGKREQHACCLSDLILFRTKKCKTVTY